MENLSNNSKSKSDNFVLIVENVGEDLKLNNSQNGSTILEGVCAVFGQENNNHRIYEKEEYLPHLSYLQDKIKKGQLVGDLDHPPHFDVTLKSASHIVEQLNYDGGNKVNIKLRILENTPNGKIAKALLDGGVNLSISSRAAGEVLNEGKVRLHRIFTYDLVGEPGFTEAILKKTVNESLQGNFEMLTEGYNALKHDSYINRNELQNISESLSYDDNFKIYKINKTIEPKILEACSILTEKNNNEMADNKFVTKDSMEGYSNLVSKEFSKLRSEITKNKTLLTESVNNGESVNLNELANFVNYLAENLEGVINFAEYMSEKINESVHYTEHVAQVANNSIGYTQYVGEKLNTSIKHNDYIAEKLNMTINFADYLKESLNGSLNYQNYLAKELDESIQYTEYVGEGSNNAIKYAENLAENINHNRGYMEYIAEKAGQGIGYTEHVVEALNNGEAVGTKRNLMGNVERLTESTSIDSLIEKVDTVIAEVTTDSSKAVLESRYPFLKVINEDSKQKFYKLDKDVKQSIVETLGASMWFNESDVLGIMDSVVNESSKNIPNYIKFMPETYKAVYGKMNESEKGRAYAKSQLYTLNTPYQVKSFWDEYDMRGINERIEIESQNSKLETLNESQGTEGMVSIDRVVEQNRGYSSTYLETLQRRGDNR